jgi:hypothetical protein
MKWQQAREVAAVGEAENEASRWTEVRIDFSKRSPPGVDNRLRTIGTLHVARPAVLHSVRSHSPVGFLGPGTVSASILPACPKRLLVSRNARGEAGGP